MYRLHVLAGADSRLVLEHRRKLGAQHVLGNLTNRNHHASDGAYCAVVLVGATGSLRTMNVYLVRHAIAFDPDPTAWPDDRERPLTPDGEKKFRRAARGLRELVRRVDVVLSSPLTRAWQTADILHARAGWPEPVHFDQLEPGRPPAEVVEALMPHANVPSLALVGHEPSLHELASYLLTGDPTAARLTMKKGGVACLAFPDSLRAASAELGWLVGSGLLRALD
jgi:phosphohistidine phosphatase